MAPTKIREAISNYLNFMVFINSASSETLRAYRSDLLQAFELKPADLQSIEHYFQGNGAPTGKQSVISAEDELLAICRSALRRWASLAPSSRNRKSATLKSFLGWLHQEGAIGRDLASQLPSPKVPARLPHFLSVDEIQALLASLRQDLEEAAGAKADGNAERTRLLVLLLYGGGLRISEACSLQWASISEDARVLRITGKGKKERITALPPLVASAVLHFRRLYGGRSELFVFGGDGLPTRQGYELVRRAGVRAGLLKPLHPHALRHSFATHLLSNGANLRSLQELLGHESLQATSRYTHLGIDQLARTLEDFHPLAAKNRKS